MVFIVTSTPNFFANVQFMHFNRETECEVVLLVSVLQLNFLSAATNLKKKKLSPSSQPLPYQTLQSYHTLLIVRSRQGTTGSRNALVFWSAQLELGQRVFTVYTAKIEEQNLSNIVQAKSVSTMTITEPNLTPTLPVGYSGNNLCFLYFRQDRFWPMFGVNIFCVI